ncbi:hypothetical protein OUZ56_014445 [Daphnia magna]|uniref:Uncharacterized protein n=1 Tax=Daphnia magna TaxID=35525 RepID=A0ABR0AJS5_9CRUS|nr:hypothetical protein OUZ56_014445 [Daphnia magna]
MSVQDEQGNSRRLAKDIGSLYYSVENDVLLNRSKWSQYVSMLELRNNGGLTFSFTIIPAKGFSFN